MAIGMERKPAQIRKAYALLTVVMSDADFLEASTLSQQAEVQRNASLSLAAQGNRLPAALLKLVS